ncbi:MAG: DUF3990 domain-containing protein [Erysipelotrichaceae bacterium]|nr:DUF3990 domain-containing protein [Erysipelotrichaceae bacterium]
MILYHGSREIVPEPEIRKTRFTKDFAWGFYCKTMQNQAERWATRFKKNGYVNIYEYIPNENLNIKVFSEVNDEWLDFIARCRNGETHSYDIVEGPMADDTIYNYVERYLNGLMDKEEFLLLAKFKHPTHQFYFHTISALKTISFVEAREVKYESK